MIPGWVQGKSLQYPPDSGLNFESPIEVLIQMWIHLGTWVKGRVREGRERDVCFWFFVLFFFFWFFAVAVVAAASAIAIMSPSAAVRHVSSASS
jgi:hypothetical protein